MEGEMEGDLLLSKVDVPEGQSGIWSVKRFTVSKQDASFFNLQLLMHGEGYRSIQPGTYTGLFRDGSFDNPIMSDTPAEIHDHYAPVRAAQERGGNVLIAGLGLGVVLQAILQLPNVQKATVIEIDRDVIDLVAPHYLQKFGKERLEIVQADALAWKPNGRCWDVAWFDIWDNICADNKAQMALLTRRYAKKVAWKGCWSQDQIRRGR
jgi:hypothetical protein